MEATAENLPRRPRGYRPIADYAIIGDTLTMALIARDGSLDWLCLPDPDSPSLFAALLDSERGGRFFVGPSAEARSTRCYLDHSAVLRTRHETSDGVFEVTDFMPLALEGMGALRPARRVLRLIEAVEGRPEVAISISPRPDYGARMPKLRRLGRLAWSQSDGRMFTLFQSEIPLDETEIGTLTGRVRLERGEKRQISLSYTVGDPGIVPPLGAPAEADLRATLGWWRDLGAEITYDGPFRDAVIRSLITLRLMTFSQSGAVLAAATSSLPETIGGARNYDYRYCWLRDASFVLNAFAALHQTDVAGAFFRWLMHATQLTAPRLGTYYTVFGRTGVTQTEIETLEGYRGSAPVYRGNAATTQLQLDAYGSVMTAVAAYASHGGRLGRSEQRRLRGMARVVRRDWTLPDDGLWEMPGPRVHNTYSKVMCWAALDAYVALCHGGHIGDDPAPWEKERNRIRENILQHAWNDSRQAFTGAYGRDWLDASLTLMPRMGIVAADDPRMVATYERLEEELGHGAQMRRYAEDVDGLPGREGTFTVCGFWAADYLARRGDLDAAEARIAEMLSHANDLHLMAEELDPETGEQLGNFPQGFSHAGLIGAALALYEARCRREEASG